MIACADFFLRCIFQCIRSAKTFLDGVLCPAIRLTVTSRHHGNLTPAGLPAGRTDWHGSIIMTVICHRFMRVVISQSHTKFPIQDRVWYALAHRFPYNNGNVSAQGYLVRSPLPYRLGMLIISWGFCFVKVI